ncbi:uncharacterized protein LOC126668587 [Mercurialis annua]|uniref:uncharacterized protein LOC126668587 n=1 Tax=Mercurialis annua TaxID=3986 RepID=UPI00215F9ACB|nr:uncharacterized protein LOC126668587 [Mercurialis annua]
MESFPLIWKQVCEELLVMDSSLSSFTMFCFLLWHIWKSRNAAIFRHEVSSEIETVSLATQACQEFTHAQSIQLVPHISLQQRHPTSSPLPPSDYIKINVDAATDQHAKLGTIAAIAKNHLRVVVSQFSALFRSIWDPRILEFLVVREALNWASSQKWQKVIIEGDALRVIQSVNSSDSYLAAAWGVCCDIWHLQGLFHDCIFCYTPRTCNVLAHNLAQNVKRAALLL